MTDSPPAAPSNVAATPNDDAVTLDWQSNSEEDFSRYDLFRAVASGGFQLHAEGLAVSGFTDNDVANGTEYRYYVVAIDTDGNASEPSAIITATPVAPAPTSRTATLAWSMPTENEDGTPLGDLEGCTLHWGTSSGSYSQQIDVGQATEHTIELPGPGTYFFAATARTNSGLVSRFSAEVSKTFEE